jgi:hypothetical protein
MRSGATYMRTMRAPCGAVKNIVGGQNIVGGNLYARLGRSAIQVSSPCSFCGCGVHLPWKSRAGVRSHDWNLVSLRIS